MKIYMKWLKEYVDYQGSSSEAEIILTKAGLEVEGIEEIGNQIDQVIVAKVKAKGKHPNADKLSVCTVFDGKEDLQVVCGASNVAEGQTIAFAPIGCILPGKDNPKGFKIKKSKIRDIESFGMICAEDELGLSEDHDGIMILDDSLKSGTPLVEALGLPRTILETSITPNRPDCLSYMGTAREIAASQKLPLKTPEHHYQNQSFDSTDLATVEIATEDCPRYMGLGIKNVVVAPSPAWLKEYLEAAGIRSINNVVDITNFVMLETGSPLHAFDADTITGKKIIVRKAQEGEKMITLDGEQRELLTSDTLICDAEKPVALAGVMGGANSEISEQTKNVFIEVAYFNPICVRKTSRRLGLQTDSSYRFERGIDPNNLPFVIKRTAYLLEKYAKGEVSQQTIDCYPNAIKPLQISLRVSRVNQILGTALNSKKIQETLQSIELDTKEKEANILEVTVPTFRPDISREIDLIEEVARLIGFENIAYSTPKMNIQPIQQNPIINFTNRVKDIFAESGFNETISFHFTGVKDIQKLQILEEDPRSKPVAIKNPIVEDLSHLQTSLLPNLLRGVKLNENHFEKNIQIFEVGRIFIDQQFKDQLKDVFANKYYRINEFVKNDENRIIERAMVAGILTGVKAHKSWNQVEAKADFFTLKGKIEAILKKLRIKNLQWDAPRKIDTYFHPTKSNVIKSGNITIGTMGQIHPSVASAYDLDQTPYAFELDIASLMRCQETNLKWQKISKFPAVSRDLAFAFDKSVKWADIKFSILNLKLNHLVSCQVFDLFEGGNLEAHQKSLAISLTFQSDEKTLEEKDTQNALNKAVDCLKTTFAAIQR